MKFKKFLHQKNNMQKEEISEQSNDVELSNKEVQITSTFESIYLKQMVKNQERAIENELYYGNDTSLMKLTIPILENVFPKLLIPYIVTLRVPDNCISHLSEGWWSGFEDYGIDITCPDKFSSQSTMIDTIGSEIAYSLDKVPLARFMHIGEHKSTVPTLTKLNYSVEDLDKISDGLKSRNSNNQSKDKEDIYLICNNSDEVILQSTKRYYQVNNLEFKDKPFKVGIFANKYIVFITPLINQGKLFMFNSSFRNSFFFGFYQLKLLCRGNYKAIARIFSTYIGSRESLQTYCKLIYLH